MSRYIDADYILDGIKNDRALIQDGKAEIDEEHIPIWLAMAMLKGRTKEQTDDNR